MGESKLVKILEDYLKKKKKKENVINNVTGDVKNPNKIIKTTQTGK